MLLSTVFILISKEQDRIRSKRIRLKLNEAYIEILTKLTNSH